jgi:hypothetical protein
MGGFEYTASWNAVLSLHNSTDGALSLVLNMGLGDTLDKHNFKVTAFSSNATSATMLVDGQRLTMEWVAHDVVWNGTYDNYYAASWGSDAPPNELIGKISPATFPGVSPSWYLELRLH